MPHLRDFAVNRHINAQLLPNQPRERAAIPKVDPISNAAIGLLVHRLALDDPVEALGAGDGRRQPDLLVGRLLVQDVGADATLVDSEDAGLEQTSDQSVNRTRMAGMNKVAVTCP